MFAANRRRQTYRPYYNTFYSNLKILKTPDLINIKFPCKYFNIIINVSHFYSQTVLQKLIKFLKNQHNNQSLPIILPCTFPYRKQSDFKKVSRNTVFKFLTSIKTKQSFKSFKVSRSKNHLLY